MGKPPFTDWVVKLFEGKLKAIYKIVSGDFYSYGSWDFIPTLMFYMGLWMMINLLGLFSHGFKVMIWSSIVILPTCFGVYLWGKYRSEVEDR